MKRLLILAIVLALCTTGAFADKEEKKAEIDAMAQGVLDELMAEKPDAKKLHGEAYGYAVFSQIKAALGVSGGGGSGVAVHKGTAERTYMKMGTGGVGLGIGVKKYQVVFLFETEKAFNSFLESGWQADTAAGASAGSAAADVETTFKNGVAYWQITDKGLMASADISGTKYWKNDKLNEE